ncbi:MAG: TVP38/TMEM64 family protein [Acidisphaera sp.]|nr:TVP38/TMEM64 family protein [Acidisphaera sp.]
MARVIRLLPVLVLAGIVLLFYGLGLQHEVSWTALAAHRTQLQGAIIADPVATAAVYVGVYVLITALSLPGGVALDVIGGALFGTVLCATLTVLGATIGAVVLFLAARYAFAEMFAAKAGPVLARMRPGLERDGFSYLLALRLVPVFPFWLVNLVPALAGMRLAPYALATFLGIIPGSVVFASLGAGLGTVLSAGREPDFSAAFAPQVLLPLLGLAALSLLPVAWRRWRARTPGP